MGGVIYGVIIMGVYIRARTAKDRPMNLSFDLILVAAMMWGRLQSIVFVPECPAV